MVDADQVARDVVAPGQPALEAIVARFGADMRRSDGRLDREALGSLVFGDQEARRALESIMHPAIARRSQQRFTEYRAAGHAMVFYEASLLIEVGRHRAMQALVVVSTTRAVQRERLLARNPELGPDGALARIASQMPLDEKEALADFVIENNGSRQDLERQVDRTIAALKETLGG